MMTLREKNEVVAMNNNRFLRCYFKALTEEYSPMIINYADLLSLMIVIGAVMQGMFF